MEEVSSEGEEDVRRGARRLIFDSPGVGHDAGTLSDPQESLSESLSPSLSSSTSPISSPRFPARSASRSSRRPVLGLDMVEALSSASDVDADVRSSSDGSVGSISLSPRSDCSMLTHCDCCGALKMLPRDHPLRGNLQKRCCGIQRGHKETYFDLNRAGLGWEPDRDDADLCPMPDSCIAYFNPSDLDGPYKKWIELSDDIHSPVVLIRRYIESLHAKNRAKLDRNRGAPDDLEKLYRRLRFNCYGNGVRGPHRPFEFVWFYPAHPNAVWWNDDERVANIHPQSGRLQPGSRVPFPDCVYVTIGSIFGSDGTKFTGFQPSGHAAPRAPHRDVRGSRRSQSSAGASDSSGSEPGSESRADQPPPADPPRGERGDSGAHFEEPASPGHASVPHARRGHRDEKDDSDDSDLGGSELSSDEDEDDDEVIVRLVSRIKTLEVKAYGDFSDSALFSGKAALLQIAILKRELRRYRRSKQKAHK